MPEIKEARAIIQKVLALAEALPGSPQTEVQLGGGRLALTRFAENAIHQNVEESNLEVSVRVLLDGGRSARAATNRLTDEGLSAVVARALALARLNAPDPEMLPLYAGSESERTKVFETHVDAATDAFGPMDRAKAVVDVIAEVKKAGLKCAGRLSTRRGSIGSYGETGMAHLLEHLVFMGTPDHQDIKKEISERGGFANGTTWWERTNYFQTLPSEVENLEWALRMEADRMVNSFISAEDLESEMTVVRNEFEIGENNPFRVLLQRVMRSVQKRVPYMVSSRMCTRAVR